jgi:hypothetical protein
MRFLARTLPAALAACICAAPALAQPRDRGATLDEIRCIYTNVSDDTLAMMADLLLSPDDVTEPEIDVAIASVSGECTRKHGWTTEQRDTARVAAIYGAYADAVEQELVFLEYDIDPILATLRTLPPEDALALLDPEWMSDDALVDRLKTALAANDFPGVGDDLFLAMELMWPAIELLEMIETWPVD